MPYDEEFLLAALLHDVGKGIDPQDQEQRFQEQLAHKDDETPGEVDVDYVTDAEKTECRETVATLDAYGADVCEDLGWQD